ncbi:MAG TPA: hypothetical protein VGB51_08165 [Actinomycetota bacterium]
MLRILALPLSLLLLSSCADPDVSLTYGTEPGLRVQYRLTLEAEITRALGDGEPQRQTLTATFRAGQEILEPSADGSTTARMSLDPVSLVVDGAAQNVGPGQAFVVTLGDEGEIVSIEDASTGETAEPLELVGIERLLPRLRPVLPETNVEVGDGWTGETSFSDTDGTFSLSSSSRLERLGLAQGHEAALIRTTYTSPVDRREVFANAEADLVGRDVGAQEAWFALEGFLVEATGDSVGRYRVTFRPPGGDDTVAPVQGSLVVSLHTEMTLV